MCGVCTARSQGGSHNMHTYCAGSPMSNYKCKTLVSKISADRSSRSISSQKWETCQPDKKLCVLSGRLKHYENDVRKQKRNGKTLLCHPKRYASSWVKTCDLGQDLIGLIRFSNLANHMHGYCWQAINVTASHEGRADNWCTDVARALTTI